MAGQKAPLSDPVLSVRKLTTRLSIGNEAHAVVDELSFDLYPGRTLAIVGESGCGKSMTALSLLRILPHPPALPSEGEVVYQGKNLLEISNREMRDIRGAKIAMIFQDPMSALNPVYTIGYQLAEVAAMHLGLYDDEAEARCVQALEEVQITDAVERLNDYPHQLSGGMKQRVMIAMALMCEPDVLIADEPTTALDVTVQKQVLGLIADLQRKKGMALLLITHDMGVVAEVADEVIVMYATQAVERGDVYNIFDNKAHPYTQGLFNSLPTAADRDGKPLDCIEGTVPALGQMPSGCHFHPRCPHAMPKCQKGSVPAFDLKAPGHQATCWLHSPEDSDIGISIEEQNTVTMAPGMERTLVNKAGQSDCQQGRM
ncbi:Probable peptide ABC transporter ATP-binding protein y4tR [Chlamydiales bacterium SCGC AG-110-P3]|nr:Probable peptide ABC transporter ATP-binding protein y4tR [Chlamydiales bacterium SCGC AG-110-P3]